jgi:hypothetical protein
MGDDLLMCFTNKVLIVVRQFEQVIYLLHEFPFFSKEA